MEFSVLTYNVDGLPETLDLNDLPWIFKPIVWIYKWIKKTTIIRINDNVDTATKMKSVSSYLNYSKVDIIGVQEDFNYHTELTEFLQNHNEATYAGGFDLANVFSSMTWFLPRFKADGLELFTKKSRIEVKEEDIIGWKHSHGYFGNANDKLTHKGFRYYSLKVDSYGVDLYLLHMDADFYNPEDWPDVSGDIEARKKQFTQLTKYILKRGVERPTIIMGDTNSTDKYVWDVDNVKDYLLTPINDVPSYHIKEALPENYIDVDRIFYINNSDLDYQLHVSECYFDKSVCLSDHTPLIAIFKIISNK